MAISPKMLAVLQKVDAKREEHFANLRERGKQEAAAKVRAKKAAKKTQAAKKTPPIPKPPVSAQGSR